MYLMRNHDIWIYVRCANSDPRIAFDRLYDLIDEAAGHGFLVRGTSFDHCSGNTLKDRIGLRSILRMKVRPKSPIVCIFAAAAILHGNLKNLQGKHRQNTARKIQNKKYRNRLYRRFRYFLWEKCFMRLSSQAFLWLFSPPQTRQLAFPAWRKRGSTDR